MFVDAAELVEHLELSDPTATEGMREYWLEVVEDMQIYYQEQMSLLDQVESELKENETNS